MAHLTSPRSNLFSVSFFSILLLLSLTPLCFGQGHEIDDIVDDIEEDLRWLDEKEEDVGVVQSRWMPRKRDCDLSVGRWVFDESYPLYDANCPYISTRLSCQKNGRPDSDYQKWRWKAHGCSIPRFDALKFLGRMRGKRMMLVGDSIMRNQWESLVCLIHGVLPPEMKTVTYDGPSMAFRASEFEASIEFNWAPFLVELSVDRNNKRILHLDSIEENAKLWRGVDILVFDSAHWWTHSEEWSSWDFFMEGGRMFTGLNPMVAYEKGLTTWSKWVDLNLNPHQTRVIFRSVSPRHNRENGLKCYNQKEPLGYFKHKPRVPGQYTVLQTVLRRTRFPVRLLDITEMSALRRDGHPSVYSYAVSNEAVRAGNRPVHAPDCSHWCLPGVPDAWNEMLYSLLTLKD